MVLIKLLKNQAHKVFPYHWDTVSVSKHWFGLVIHADVIKNPQHIHSVVFICFKKKRNKISTCHVSLSYSQLLVHVQWFTQLELSLDLSLRSNPTSFGRSPNLNILLRSSASNDRFISNLRVMFSRSSWSHGTSLVSFSIMFSSA